MNRTHFLTLSLLLLIFSANADQPEINITAANIHGYGTFLTSHSARVAGFTRDTMPVDSVKGVRFDEYTTEIPGQLKTNFGFEYSINTQPGGAKLPIKSVIHFPKPGLQNPNGKIHKSSTERRRVDIGGRYLHGYGFDEPWEIVLGEWVFEIWHGDVRLIRKTFVVLDLSDNTVEKNNQ